MFLSAASVTEVIAHFIGYFELQVEAGRLRWDLQPFTLPPPPPPAEPDLPQVNLKFAPTLELAPYAPTVPYTPPHWSPADARLAHVTPVKAPFPHLHGPDSAAYHPQFPGFHLPASDAPPAPSIGDAPGAVTVHVNQVALLVDNDTVSVGDVSTAPILTPFDGQAFDSFLTGALEHAPHLDAAAPTQVGDIPAFLADTAAALDQYVDSLAPIDDPALHADITASSAPDLAGTWINGVAVAAPPLAIAPAPAADAPAAPEPTSASLDIAPNAGGALTLEAGGNIVANAATFIDAAVTPATLIVMGDHHQVDAIVQTNAWSDTDTVAAPVQPLADAAADSPTAAYNIASFHQQTLAPDTSAAVENPGLMPQNWVVSTIAGDLTFAAWTTQYNFVLDNDVATLNASGLNATITTGDNYVLNGVAFADLGRYFDMVVVGGDYYDGNVISQTNVLFDDDSVLANGACGTGSVATGGNLLWNSASITHVGPAAIETGIPGTYADAAHAVAGDRTMPDALKADSSFEGNPFLRVLYVEGNVYDLCYVQQVNVLGDADQVALARQQVADDHPDSEWDIRTGGNLVANTASIVDYDTVGQHAYVAGGTYAHDILIQAEIVAGDDMPGLGPDDPASAPLANEAIAFLDSGADLTPAADDHLSFHMPHSDAPSLDALHSVLA